MKRHVLFAETGNFSIKWIVAVGLLIVVMCTGNKKKDDSYAVKIGNDSLAVSCIEKALQGKGFIPADTVHAMFACILTYMGSRESENAADSSLMTKLAEQLSMRTGQVWTRDDASRALRITAVLDTYFKNRGDSSRAFENLRIFFRDSLVFSNLALKDRVISLADSLLRSKISKSNDARQPLFEIVEKILGVSTDDALVIMEFFGTKETTPDVDYKKIAKGLVYEPKKMKPKKSIHEKPKQEFNSALALKYRNEQSIQTSIQKHEANLKELYKRQLKLTPTIEGMVWVRFQVRASGEVENVSVYRSDIHSARFIKELESYLQTIRFKKIPNEVGGMVFEYPFDFTPDS